MLTHLCAQDEDEGEDFDPRVTGNGHAEDEDDLDDEEDEDFNETEDSNTQESSTAYTKT